MLFLSKNLQINRMLIHYNLQIFSIIFHRNIRLTINQPAAKHCPDTIRFRLHYVIPLRHITFKTRGQYQKLSALTLVRFIMPSTRL